MVNARNWRQLTRYLVVYVCGASLLLVTPMLLIGRILPEDEIGLVPAADQIAFMYNPPGLVPEWDIYLLDLRTGITAPVITTDAQDRYPEWSADGSRLSYHSNPNNLNRELSEGGPFDLFIADENGANIQAQNLPDVSASENKAMIAWSPDGTRIAFHAGEGYTVGNPYVIYISEPNGDRAYPIVEQPYFGEMIYATWSPDGTKIAYVVDQSRAVSLAGSNATVVVPRNQPGNRLPPGAVPSVPVPMPSAPGNVPPSFIPQPTPVPNSTPDVTPQVTPQITPDPNPSMGQGRNTPTPFPRTPPQTAPNMFDPNANGVSPNDPPYLLYVVEVGTGVDGPFGEPELLHSSNEDILFPAWSPDGEMIAFSAGALRGEDLYTLHLPTGEVKQLTFSGLNVENTQPDWTADGERIIFMSNQDGDFDIYSIRPDGTDLERLTNLPGDEWAPDWRPRTG